MRRILLALALALLACAHPTPHTTATPPPFCAALLGDFAAHATNAPRFNTPLLTGPDGALYVCYITPALATVVQRSDPLTGSWGAPTTLTAITQADKFHNQCSIGQDARGYLHAAANMHDTPWQYWVSRDPHSVQTMTWRGQEAGSNPGAPTPPKSGCTGVCETNWYANEPGLAALPGNQITYPHFATTVDGTLFVGFRECLKCDASFHSRQWSAGLAQYHLAAGTWSRVAGIRPWATAEGKLAIGLRLAGDYAGRLHASWVWCNAYNEEEGGQACFAHQNFVTYARSDDHGLTWQTSTGTPLTLPIAPQESEVVSGPDWFEQVQATGYYDGHTQLTVDTARSPTVVVFPNTTTSDKGIKRGPVTRQASGWSAPPRVLDYSPSLVYRDRQGRWIAVSSGMRIHVSTDEGQTWTLYPLDLDAGAFDFAWDRGWLRATGHLRLYAQSSATGRLRIWSLTWPESGRCSP